jgi:hypothetical protein
VATVDNNTQQSLTMIADAICPVCCSHGVFEVPVCCSRQPAAGWSAGIMQATGGFMPI